MTKNRLTKYRYSDILTITNLKRNFTNAQSKYNICLQKADVKMPERFKKERRKL